MEILQTEIKMSLFNRKIYSEKIRLLLLTVILLSGIFLAIKPEKDNISSFKKDNISVTVINVKDKPTVHMDKIIGVILILFAGFGYYFTSQMRSNSNNNKIELTPQEKKIYSFIKQGYSNKEIASEFNISVSTVKTHINNIYKKEGISSRKELTDNQSEKKD